MYTQAQTFNCTTDYALETLNTVNLAKLEIFFENLPVDPYLDGGYRFRRLSRFKIQGNRVLPLPHGRLYQTKSYNPLLGGMVREFAELEPGLINLEDFQKICLEFFDFCQLCTSFDEIDVHQIRTVALPQVIGHPAPEGIHQDGVDLVGIFCVTRRNIEGGLTSLFRSKESDPIFTKILNPGELLVFNDKQFFHYTSKVNAIASGRSLPIAAEPGIRDVFVLTCPGLFPPENTEN
jgi:histidine decarboxylase